MPNVRVPRQVSQRRTSQSGARHASSPTSSPLLTFFKRLVLLLIISIFVASFGAVFYLQSQATWDQQTRYNLLLIQKSEPSVITLLSLNGRQTQAFALTLPTTLQLDLLGDRSVGQPAEIYSLLQAEQFSEVQAILGYQFGFIPDSWLIVTSDQEVETVEDLQEVLSFQSIREAESKLSLMDRLSIWKFVSRLRPAQTFVIDHQQLTRSADGGSQLDQNAVSEQFTAFLSDFDLQKENITLAVVNTTQFNGIATRIGRVFSQIGFRIINISSNNTQPLEKTVLFVRAGIEEDPRVIETVQHLFPFEVQVEVSDEEVEKYRADMVLLLGLDNAYFQVEK